MDIIIVFFRDVLSGLWYYLYLLIGIIAIFYLLGIIADRRREAIAKKLKEKKTYDIESGREAEIAARESKQVLDVDDNNDAIMKNQNMNQNQGANQNANVNATINAAVNAMPNTNDAAVAKKEEEKVPTVMVLNSSDINSQGSGNANTNTVEPPKQEPVVIDSSSITAANNQ